MDTSLPSELILNLSQTIDVLAIIISIVALVVTVIGFFASLKFYRDGVDLQQLANQALVKIEEKASNIQTQVGGMFEKTLDAAITNREQITTDFDAINEQLKKTGTDLVDAALQEIGTAGTEEREKIKEIVDSRFKELSNLLENMRANAEEAVSNIPPQSIIKPQDILNTATLMNIFSQHYNTEMTSSEFATGANLPLDIAKSVLRNLAVKGIIKKRMVKRKSNTVYYYSLAEAEDDESNN